VVIKDELFRKFVASIDSIALPSKFTYPFCYEPHSLSLLAAAELQSIISKKEAWQNGFGPGDNPEGMGKMFGILVVKNSKGELGYLAAFSGKLLGVNDHEGFVPPVFDLLKEDGFYRIGEEEINKVTRSIELLESNEQYLSAKRELASMLVSSKDQINEYKLLLKSNKQRRDQERLRIAARADEESQAMTDQLNNESIHEKYQLKDLMAHWKYRITEVETIISAHVLKIDGLKALRKSMSYDLQKELFKHYSFLNALGETKDLNTIFEVTTAGPPPSGAGECAAPKLFQYAFRHGYGPVCMAEFWWGPSPLSEVRKHGLFYPSCKSKCEPILGHMLKGLEVEDNPLLHNPAIGKNLVIVYEDDALVIVNKPAEFLSVPGVNISDSVYTRIKELYPKATGPLIVHRLDMSTSGLLLIAKNKQVHKFLQRQFIKRTIKKRYTALLDGVIDQKEGLIELPLRLDVDNRPTQLVDFVHGKPAVTRYEVVAIKDGNTLVHFYPLTGRTHQLRVHAAHPLGLNTPIVGDDLYGKRADRLYLHAAELEFLHPESREIVVVTNEEDWK
jgi:tRNA pseudouridine32 synthase / 23S rRNA pseudouridine746 synthase